MDQSPEGSLGSRSRATDDRDVFREILPSQATEVLVPNVLSLTQHKSGRERQRPRSPVLTQVKTLDVFTVHHDHPLHLLLLALATGQVLGEHLACLISFSPHKKPMI